MTTEAKRHHPIRRARRDDGAEERANPANEAEQPPRRERRALSHVGGEVQFQGGNDSEQETLTQALDVSADEDQVMQDVHGFHSYPARLHPATARRLIEGLSAPGARVLDPFCGSGTVVVEARALGRVALGSDLNPLAVELSWLKSRGPTQKLTRDMVNAAHRIAEIAEERRVAKAEPYQRYGDEDRERYPIHILLELDSVAHGISLIPKTEVSRMLRLVVSSMLTKLAHSEGDTTRRKAPRRLPGGFAIQLFLQKAEELGRRLEAYRERVVDKSPRAYVDCTDARTLEKIESDSVDLIITSPPYPGVYDYLDHHLHRIRWLGLRDTGLRQGEIGARREYRRLSLREAADLWQREIGATLYELRRTLAQDGRGIMVIADSVVDRRPLRADEQIRAVAERAGIDITCIASQERPLFLHGADQAFSDRPRMEHVVVFRPGLRPHRRPRFDGDSRRDERGARRFDGPRDDRPRRFDAPRDDRPRRFDAPRDDRAPRDQRPARQGQRANQARTWDSSPRGPGSPRSKFGKKPM